MSLPIPSYNDDKNSFAYPTVHKRWPTIIEGAIKDIKTETESNSNLRESSISIINQLNKLLDDFRNDVVVSKFEQSQIDLNPDLSHYNNHYDELAKIKQITWLTGPWLYLECYVYQFINTIFLSSSETYWHKFDVFQNLKNLTFKQSELGVNELSKRYKVLNTQLISNDKLDDETLKILFSEFIDISLWGNATDLSLLAGNVSIDDIKSVQGAEVRKKNEEKIIVNDLSQAWNYLKNSSHDDNDKQIDIVLDNSGFELFTDLILSLFLLDSKLINKVKIHCKEIPWFVSDTMPKDFDLLLDQLIDENFYKNIHQDKEDHESIKFLHSKLNQYYKDGNIVVSHHKFWTLSYNYWDIPKFTDLYQELSKSDLIIFKGDLNYRKLTGDLQWDKTTPFKTALQDLSKSKLPVLSLRTCKADVVVGLPQGLHEKLSTIYKDQGNEIGELWTASGKWAVISFNSGN